MFKEYTHNINVYRHNIFDKSNFYENVQFKNFKIIDIVLHLFNIHDYYIK